jgi:hypothetical protein
MCSRFEKHRGHLVNMYRRLTFLRCSSVSTAYTLFSIADL